jgi:Ca-activated chloride channel homolog
LLLLLPFFLLLFLGYHWWKKRAMRKTGNPQLIKNLLTNHSRVKPVLKLVLLLLAFALGCLAVANPRRPDESLEGVRKGIDIVVAMDVSNSMLASDIEPNRLGRAKQFISRLLDNLQDDRTGLVVFAGSAYAQMPLTFDREAARMYVNTSHPSQIPAQGTSISDALQKSDIVLGEQTERFRSIILITDGETHDENALEKAKELAAKGIMINTVGIGSVTGSTIVDTAGRTKMDATGQPVLSKLNVQILKEIAQSTNGSYVHLESSEDAVKGIMDQFSQIEKKALGDKSLLTYQSFYAWLALPMLLMLVAEVFFPDRKKVKP